MTLPSRPLTNLAQPLTFTHIQLRSFAEHIDQKSIEVRCSFCVEFAGELQALAPYQMQIQGENYQTILKAGDGEVTRAALLDFLGKEDFYTHLEKLTLGPQKAVVDKPKPAPPAPKKKRQSPRRKKTA